MKAARNFAILALLALVLVVAPGGGPALEVMLTLLTIAFFASIAFLGYRLYREHHFTLESLGDRERLVLYTSVGLAFLTFVGTARLWHVGGGGIIAWMALLGLASYGVFWVFQRSRDFG
jgi:predicted DNA repair protein MutK